MKKLMAAAALFLVFTAFSFAQNAQTLSPEPASKEAQKADHAGRGKMHKGKGKHGKMGKELGLSKEQGAQVRKMNDGYKGRMKAIKSDNSLSKEQKRAQMKDLHQKHDEEMKGILSDQQYGKWQEARKNHVKQRREKRDKKQ